jgi:hypothetical protein
LMPISRGRGATPLTLERLRRGQQVLPELVFGTLKTWAWLGWGRLHAAGYPEPAERVRGAILTAIESLGRAPRLFG